MLMLLSSTVNPAEIINQLFPNLWVFIAHIIATIILLILLSKWVYNPFRKAMRARRQKIQEMITDAADKQTKATIKEKTALEMLTTAKVDASSIISEARAEAEAKKHNLLDETKKEIVHLNEQARKELAKEKEQYQDDIRKAIINTAFDAAQHLLEKEINKEKHQKIIEDFIDNLN
ncbi:F0F1 ATP synthase subunit B [Spiroplasma chrysopicola DF-1]|uniref:ATP synthase subunit b n=2 Tax=Spiroplasma chrysopicola TaxID=216933 RepID=R4U2K6_9MOLU|nr:F0F1 ATP synthase subunit B [Spiroplasma chrysopicola DF-1]